MIQPSVTCLVLFMQEMAWALILAFDNAGRSMAARIAIIAMTTSNSIKVKPFRPFVRFVTFILDATETLSPRGIGQLCYCRKWAFPKSPGCKAEEQSAENEKAVLQLRPAPGQALNRHDGPVLDAFIFCVTGMLKCIAYRFGKRNTKAAKSFEKSAIRPRRSASRQTRRGSECEPARFTVVCQN